jgi:predicted nucleotidyltransferase
MDAMSRQSSRISEYTSGDRNMGISPKLQNELVRRIVEAAKPLRIVLFGSAATGTMGPDSDLDLLVVVRDGTHRRRTASHIYHCLCGLGYPKDVVVVTQEDVNQYGDNPSLIIRAALAGGRELYHAS